jgi:hypothetical protein
MTRVLDGGSEWESKLLENVVSTTCGEADGHLSHVSHAARGEQNTNCTHFCTHFPHSRRPALAHIKVPSPHSQSAHARVRASAPEALSREDKDGFRELGVLKAATVHQEFRVLRRLECGGNKEILAGESLFRKRFLATASRVSCSPKFNANEPCRYRILSPLPLASDSKPAMSPTLSCVYSRGNRQRMLGINASSGASIGNGKHLSRPGKFLFHGGYDQLVPAKGWVLKEFDPSSNFLTKALARESVAFSFPGSVARWRCVRIEGRTLVQGCRWAHSVAEETALSGKSLSQLYGAVRHRGVTLC